MSSDISHTQELRPIKVDSVPIHHHDLPTHQHESSTLGVAIGLIWLSMALLSLGFLWAVTAFVGVERWTEYFTSDNGDVLLLLFAMGLVFIPLAIASVWTTKLIKNS